MPKRGWNAFDTISVKWDHQVVATRRLKAAPQTIESYPEDDEQAPDIQTMDVSTVNATAEKKPAEETKDKKQEGDNNKKSN